MNCVSGRSGQTPVSPDQSTSFVGGEEEEQEGRRGERRSEGDSGVDLLSSSPSPPLLDTQVKAKWKFSEIDPTSIRSL